MPSYRDFVLALRQFKIDAETPVIVHSSLSTFGHVEGGPETLVSAISSQFQRVLMPSFTYRTMVTPATGPPHNGLQYGFSPAQNQAAEIFYPDMPADPLMGVVAESFRKLPEVQRSKHPILSFTGKHLDEALRLQSLEHPLAPIAKLADMGAVCLLFGVGQRANTSIHLGERLAGRKTFIRWALVEDSVQECPGFPPCSEGFDQLGSKISNIIQHARVGRGLIQAMPLAELVATVRQLVKADPHALLCDHFYCARCNAIRSTIKYF